MRVIGRPALALLVGFILTAPAPAWAIDPDRSLAECNVEIWRARDGLPGGWIRAITQTGDGYLWIGTQGGLARYGGGAIEAFAPEHPFEHGGDVMGLLVGRDGTIWIQPARGHPVCKRGDAFGACVAAPGAPLAGELPADARIVDIDQDDAGVVWVATADAIFRVTGRQLAPAGSSAAWGAAAATAVHHDRHGRLWVGTAKGLFVGAVGAAAAPLALQVAGGGALTAPVAAIFENAGGQLWVTADRQVVRIDGDRTEVFTAREGLPAGRLTTVMEDHDRNVWIGSREGLIRFQPGRGFATFTRADGLPDDDVSALYEDREGSLWIGTRAGGLVQFTDRALDRRAGPPSLADQWISTVAEDDQRALWVGTGRGLTRFFDGQEHTYTKADGLPSDQVFALLPAGRDELWVGTDRGLAHFRAGRAEPVAGVTAAVTALSFDNDGALWIGADGLARLHDGALERFALDDELRGLELGEIRSIARDDRGVVWLSANGKLLRVEGGRLRRDPSQIAAAIGKVRAIARDADGTLWFGSGDGLIRRRQGAFRVFGAAEGLGRNDLYQVAADDVGFLWIGTGHGLLRIAKASLDDVDRGRRRAVDAVSFEVAADRREVRITRTRQPGVWKTRDGSLRFASSRGVVSVDPRRLPVNPLPPPVLIERALVDGRPARRGQPNAFAPGSGAFEFQFAAITLIEARKAQHRYRLEGFDRDWVEAGTRRSAYYTNMRPGRYRFRVQGSNADGVWNETGDALELTLAPHVHQTWWFFALVGLGAAGLVLSFHRLRLERLRGRYVATLAERSRVARELHDSLLQGMSAALMHLRGLRKRFAAEAAPAPRDTVAGEIKAIEELVTTNIEETRQFVWDLRATDAPELAPALTELVARVAGGGGVDARVVVEGDAEPVPRHVQRELLRIAHEAVTNALKHAEAGHIEVRLRYQEGALALVVCDDGRGFDPDAAAGSSLGHFGVLGMRERAAALGGLRLESRPGRGTKVEVSVNLRDLPDV